MQYGTIDFEEHLIYLSIFFFWLIFSRLTKMGALKWDAVVNQHQGWRLITCIWLHAGIIHLAANMLSLVFIGIRLEQQFGFGTSLFSSSIHLSS